MTKLTKADWDNAKTEAVNSIKQGEILQINGEILLKRAELELKKFPEEEKEPIHGT